MEKFWGLPKSTRVPQEELGIGPPMGREERTVADDMLANGYRYLDREQGWMAKTSERLGRPGDHLAIRYDVDARGFVDREGRSVEEQHLAEQAGQESWGIGRTWLTFGEPDPGLPELRPATRFEQVLGVQKIVPAGDEGKALESRGFEATGNEEDPHWKTPGGQRMDPEQFKDWRFHSDSTIEQPFFDGNVGNEALEQAVRQREREKETKHTSTLKGDSVVSGISAHVGSTPTDRGTAGVDRTEHLATGFEELAKEQSPVQGPMRERDGVV